MNTHIKWACNKCLRALWRQMHWRFVAVKTLSESFHLSTTATVSADVGKKRHQKSRRISPLMLVLFIIRAYFDSTADWNIKRPEIAKKNATTPTVLVPMEERQEGSLCYCATSQKPVPRAELEKSRCYVLRDMSRPMRRGKGRKIRGWQMKMFRTIFCFAWLSGFL